MYFTKIDVHLKRVNHPERKANWDFMPSLYRAHRLRNLQYCLVNL